MTDDLRALAAEFAEKVLGWTHHESADVYPPQQGVAWRREHWTPPAGQGRIFSLPDFPRDLNAAWEGVEPVIRHLDATTIPGWRLRMSTYRMRDGAFVTQFWFENLGVNHDMDGIGICQNEIPAEALCRALIAAKESPDA